MSSQTQFQGIDEKLQDAIGRLEQARPFAKTRYQQQVIDLTRRLLQREGGLEYVAQLAARMDRAGLFDGTDWATPASLLPQLVSNTLKQGGTSTVTLECINQLRMLDIADGRFLHERISSEQARHYLLQVLAHNLNRLFGGGTEADRVQLEDMAGVVEQLFRYLSEHIGLEDILGELISEITRILEQRPIRVDNVKGMVLQIALTIQQGNTPASNIVLGADRLISALYQPTQGTQEDPGLAAYQSRLEAMDPPSLQQEAYSFARVMHDVGLVSEYHAVFLRWLLENDSPHFITDALGLSSTGIDALRCFERLIHRLIQEAIFPETAQAIYGLAMLLERGLLFGSPIAPGLWRQIDLVLSEQNAQTISFIFGQQLPARVYLLAGVISVLGQPLGVGQGNNPTCQSARAISMWAYNDPDYLLYLIAHASQFDNIQMHFEGRPINSRDVPTGLAAGPPLDTDPVSVILVPHLDRIYAEMGRLCSGRPEDPHRWINPEFHGWWVGRDFAIAVDVATGKLKDYDQFLEQFYRSYHPYYNGNQLIIHPQPIGIAVTDSSARFVGWHAISLIRVAVDQDHVIRAYFYNPNNDSGQNWGNGVVVSTSGYGERPGESSLPFSEFASRLYIFHDEPIETPDRLPVPQEEIEAVKNMAYESWAQTRLQ